MKKEPCCPQCGATDLIVEKRPDGNATCGTCAWSGPYAECFQEREREPREIRDRS